MPFSGNSYKEIVKKNMSGNISFDFSNNKYKISNESRINSPEPAEGDA